MQKVFLMSFRDFISAHRLFEMLRERFYTRRPVQISEVQFASYVGVGIVPIRMQVIEMLKSWLSAFRSDFTQNADLLYGAKDFL